MPVYPVRTMGVMTSARPRRTAAPRALRVVPDADAATGTTANADPLLTREQLAAYLNVSERHARTLIEERRVPVVAIGRALRVRRSDADALIAALVQPAVRPVRIDGYRREVWVGRAA